MADGVEITDMDYQIAMQGLKIQLSSRYGVIKDNPEQFDDFLDNTARVIAYERAYNRMLQGIVHQTNFGNYERDFGG